jgi:CBS domain-containing protein
MSNRPVRECLKRGEVLSGKCDETVVSAAKRMAEACSSSILICEQDRLLGIFTERDLLVRVVAAGLEPETTPLGEVMTRDPETIEASAPVIQAIRLMDEGNFRHLPVVATDGVLGVVSWRDLPFEEHIEVEPELDQRHRLAERIW